MEKGLTTSGVELLTRQWKYKADFSLGELEFQVSRYQWEKGRKLDMIYHFEELLCLWAHGEKKFVIPLEEAVIHKI